MTTLSIIGILILSAGVLAIFHVGRAEIRTLLDNLSGEKHSTKRHTAVASKHKATA